ncbi:MAG: VWA domain-containing protein [Propionivibrio sp.]|uniref:VWA domain-containing protein n=1 Tax=Propionivibrio sp. TaxID=2212460 RepID=UPI0025FC74E6|nr:VWA domain-containing protein [Propionivibrio sp.]MBK8399800.1 VWA domain-containing protein [Propionivibrio sp.]MBK8894674.1 VWA domain-containing protein [Propionivibrio sp.]MBL0207156.1 VWA domain-containing protein [Propionivibrio sp.]
MIHFAWPWMLLFLPLPWLIRHGLPAAKPRGDALFLPFAARVSAGGATSLPTPSKTRWLLLSLVWLLTVVASTRPQWLGDPLPVPTTGRRLMLAVDVSGSMMTRDMAGNATRLDVVQAVAGDFISHRHGDQVGLILFGTRPYLQAPLTTDLNTVDQFLQQSVIGIAGTQTAIGDAIGLAIKRMRERKDGAKTPGEMVLVLLTDGGNDAGLMDPIAAAKMAADSGLRIYTIGVGAAGQQGILGASGNNALDEDTLKSIAQITKGEYFRATDADALGQVYARIDKMEPSAGREQWYRPHSEWFLWPLALALLFSLPAVVKREKDEQ